MRLQIRPHLFLRSRLWHCIGSGCAGVGYSFQEAYGHWKDLRVKLLSGGRFG